MTLEEFIKLANHRYLASHPAERKGQAAFNALAKERPDLSEQVRGIYQLDPFHQDKYLPNFWEHLRKNW